MLPGLFLQPARTLFTKFLRFTAELKPPFLWPYSERCSVVLFVFVHAASEDGIALALVRFWCFLVHSGTFLLEENFARRRRRRRGRSRRRRRKKRKEKTEEQQQQLWLV